MPAKHLVQLSLQRQLNRHPWSFGSGQDPLSTQRRGAAVGGSVGQLALPTEFRSLSSECGTECRGRGHPRSGTKEPWVALTLSDLTVPMTICGTASRNVPPAMRAPREQRHHRKKALNLLTTSARTDRVSSGH